MHEVAGVIMFALALLCVAKLVIDKKYKSRRAAEAPSTTGTTPYRSSTPPEETAKAAEDEMLKAPLPVVIVDWTRPARKDGHFSVVCPACSSVWHWNGKYAAPQLCACNECDTTHFHIDCSGTDERGCGLNWIMRSALPKQPIITPPPGTTGTKEPS